MVQQSPVAKRNNGDDSSEIDEIREILLGVVIRRYEERFARLEQKIEDKLRMLEDDFILRANGLTQRIKTHSENMETQLTQEKDDLRQWRDELNAQLDETLAQFSERLNSSKLDRQQLAALLATLATRIEREPGSDASGPTE